MAIKAIGFDFDGVFVRDSDNVFKKDAWKIALKSYPGYEPFLEEGNSLFGWGKPGGRVEILRHVFEKLGKPPHEIDMLVEEASKSFDGYVQTEIMKVGVVDGALEMLEDLSKRSIAMYLNSGTATPALRLAAQNLKIDHFFRGILGSTPQPIGGGKVSNLQYIAQRENLMPSEMLVVGDGDSDEKAAREFGCPFVGVSNVWNNWTTDKKFSVIADLRDVSKFV